MQKFKTNILQNPQEENPSSPAKQSEPCKTPTCPFPPLDGGLCRDCEDYLDRQAKASREGRLCQNCDREMSRAADACSEECLKELQAAGYTPRYYLHEGRFRTHLYLDATVCLGIADLQLAFIPEPYGGDPQPDARVELARQMAERANTFPTLQAQRDELLKLVREFHRYGTDPTYRNEQEQRAEEMTGGNASYFDALTERAAGLIANAEKQGVGRE